MLKVIEYVQTVQYHHYERDVLECFRSCNPCHQAILRVFIKLLDIVIILLVVVGYVEEINTIYTTLSSNVGEPSRSLFLRPRCPTNQRTVSSMKWRFIFLGTYQIWTYNNNYQIQENPTVFRDLGIPNF